MSGVGILRTIWRMKWLAVVILLVFLGVSAGVTIILPKVYQATATVRVTPSEQTADSFSQLQANQALARTYSELLKSPNVYAEAVEEGDLPIDSKELMSSTTVSYVEGTELVQVQVKAREPSQASSWANTVAQTFVEGREENGGEERLVVADPAPVPTAPVSPSWPLNMALALLLGAAAAVGGVLLLNFFSDRVSPEEIEELVEAPVLGTLPTLDLDRKKGKGKARSLSAYEEAMRLVRVNVNFALGSSSGNGVLLITSALPGEGKTAVSSFLAESYARAERECLVVDADLRRPRLHSVFGLRNLRGFSNLLLEGPEALSDSVSQAKDVPRLAVLTSGQLPPNPADLLSLGRTGDLVRSLRERFDTTILDSPPAQALADASILGSLADGVVLVVNAREARRRSLSRAVEQLRSGNARILGVVLNRAPEEDSASYYYSYE